MKKGSEPAEPQVLWNQQAPHDITWTYMDHIMKPARSEGMVPTESPLPLDFCDSLRKPCFTQIPPMWNSPQESRDVFGESPPGPPLSLSSTGSSPFSVPCCSEPRAPHGGTPTPLVPLRDSFARLGLETRSPTFHVNRTTSAEVGQDPY